MSQLIRKSGILPSPCRIKRYKPLKRGKRIKSRGSKATLWDYFAKRLADRERDSDGNLTCEDCGEIKAPVLDLHHEIGRTVRPDLYFDRKNLKWLCRGPGTNDCHGKAHNEEKVSRSNSYRPVPKAKNDPARQVEKTANSGAVLPLQGPVEFVSPRRTGRTVFSSVQNRNASVVVRSKEGAL